MGSNFVTARGETFRRPTGLERLGNRLRAPLARLPLRSVVKSVYHRALMIGSGGRGLKVSLPDGEEIRLLPQFRHGGWNAAEYRAFKDAVRRGDVALDVGANVGHYSLLLGQRVGPTGQVIAFEPSGWAYRGLVGHIDLNGLDDVVTPVHMAVAAFEGEATIVTGGAPGTARLVGGAVGRGTPTEPVSVTTVDAYCAREGIAPTFIKVDVEGTELDVLRGAGRTIAAAGERLALFVEMHPRIWPGTGRGRADIERELGAQGLRAEPLEQADDAWAIEGVCMRILRC